MGSHSGTTTRQKQNCSAKAVFSRYRSAGRYRLPSSVSFPGGLTFIAGTLGQYAPTADTRLECCVRRPGPLASARILHRRCEECNVIVPYHEMTQAHDAPMWLLQ